MINETKEYMKSNPTWTYGFAIGYSIGAGAAGIGQKFASLSPEDWINETTDYAHGYRKGYLDYEQRTRKV